jgi:hypothetical protein
LFRQILQGFAVVARVVASRDRVRVLDLQQFCMSLHLLLTDGAPWILFGESVHRWSNNDYLCDLAINCNLVNYI